MANLSVGGDTFYNNVSLLLHMEGSNGSTTFTDNSIIPKTVTPNGNSQLSTNTCVFGRSSGYFDGNGDYLQVASSSDFDLSSGNFTVECWVYLSSITNTPHIFQFNGASINFRWNVFVSGGAFIVYSENGAGTGGNRITSTVKSTGQWYHVAVVKNSTTTLYINGSSEGSSNITVWPTGSLSLSLGTQFFTPVLGDYLTGYIDEFRVTKSVARYTSNFTVPTAFGPFPNSVPGDPNYTDVSLLLHLDGANGSTTFTDNSPSPKTITANDNAQISTVQSKFGGSSAYFAGTNDWLQNTTDLTMGNFGLNDFTVECWIYSNSNSKMLVDYGYTTSNTGGWQLWVTSTNKLEWYSAGGAVVTSILNVPTIQWVHIAAVRNAGTLKLYINGVNSGSANDGRNYSSALTTVFSIGAQVQQRNSSYDFNGYIDEVRITKNVARYTSNFTPPSLAFANFGPASGDPNYTDVSLLLHLDSLQSSPYSDFSSFNNSAFTITGTPTISTSIFKFGGGSVFIGGDNDISYNSSSSFAIGTADFTMECWVNYNSLTSPGYQTISNINNYSSGMMFRMNPNSFVDIYVNNAQYTFTISPALTTGTWYHVAISRNSGTLRAFINGVQQGTDRSVTGSIAAGVLKVGRSAHSSGEYTNGYIDDFRFTNGVGRYPTNFTPPTQAFANNIAGDPNYNNVSLLVHFEAIGGALIDNSPTPKTVVTNNSGYNATVSVFGPSALTLTGTNSYADVSYSTDWNIGSFTNYTIEFWIYYSSIDNNASLMGQMSASSTPNWRLYQTAINNNLSGIYFDHVDGSGILTTFGWNTITEYIAPAVWSHIAIVKTSNTWDLYINGLKQGASQTFTWTIAPTWDLTLGGVDNNTFAASAFSIDDVRITKNVARYSSNFVPTTAPFANYLTSVGNATVEPLPSSSIANLTAIDDVGIATIEPLNSSSIANLPAISSTGSKTMSVYISPPELLLTPYGTGTYTITGTVVNGSSAPLSRTVIAYDRDTNIPVDTAASDSVTGLFTLNVPNTNCYVVCLPLLTDGVNAEIFDNITPIAPI